MTDDQGWSRCETPHSLSRRAFLRLVGVAAGAVTLDAVRPTAAQEGWTTLRITAGELEVNGQKARVYNIQQPDGTSGYVGTKGQRFRVVLQNHTKETLAIHWHGILLPNGQDGVPYVTQAPIQPGEERRYDFPIVQAGTYWMHSHFGLQEQGMMTAPLILKDPVDPHRGEQEAAGTTSSHSPFMADLSTLRRRETRRRNGAS